MTRADQKIAAMQQEAREYGAAKDGDKDSIEQKLRDHIREQDKTIFDLRETLEVSK